MSLTRLPIIYIFFLLLIACSPSSPGFFGKKTPHEQYGQKLTNAGLQTTEIGKRWFDVANQGILAPLSVVLPYKETGYFASEKPSASSLKFRVKRGEKIVVSLEKKPVSSFAIYMDLWQPAGEPSGRPRFLSAADSSAPAFEYTAEKDGELILRVQPELLQSGEYTLQITSGPSLAFPIAPGVKSSIQSYWGVDRDAGARRHEGIDIFAPFRSPAVAAGNGTIRQVNENRLGGKVVFLHLDDTNYNLYYAHLDSQLVKQGQRVKPGDTLGLTGNTGNAQFTPSHLHFGIYTSGGAIDPLAFVNPVRKKPRDISALTTLLNRQARTSRRIAVSGTPQVEQNTLVSVIAILENKYKVALPDGNLAFLNDKDIVSLDKPLRKIYLETAQPLLDRSDSTAAAKMILNAGSELNLLARFGEFYYVTTKEKATGWVPVPER